MRKISLIVSVISSVIIFYYIVQSSVNILRSDWKTEIDTIDPFNKPHIILITQELNTPFWDKVMLGASGQAIRDGANLELWGSYGRNEDDFLKQIEVAIYSKVDGIIVQGLDTKDFKEIMKLKATSYGIPIITIANDVPIEESLRRTYVGSNQHLAGALVAEQLVKDMGTQGEVVLMLDRKQEYYQKMRLEGFKEKIQQYADIKLIMAETGDTKELVTSSTRNIMNQFPSIDSFIVFNASLTANIMEEIERRSKIDSFFIYSFDDAPESLSLLEKGMLDGMIQQSPEEMGKLSVKLMMEWLNNTSLPLERDGYITKIKMVEATQ